MILKTIKMKNFNPKDSCLKMFGIKMLELLRCNKETIVSDGIFEEGSGLNFLAKKSMATDLCSTAKLIYSD